MIKAALVEDKLKLYAQNLLAALTLGLSYIRRYVTDEQVGALMRELRKPDRISGCSAKDMRSIFLGNLVFYLNT